MLQAILVDAVYGGRVDNEFDFEVLQAFVRHIFREESFKSKNITAIEQTHKINKPKKTHKLITANTTTKLNKPILV